MQIFNIPLSEIVTILVALTYAVAGLKFISEWSFRRIMSAPPSRYLTAPIMREFSISLLGVIAWAVPMMIFAAWRC